MFTDIRFHTVVSVAQAPRHHTVNWRRRGHSNPLSVRARPGCQRPARRERAAARRGPVVLVELPGHVTAWVVTRHELQRQVLTDPRVAKSSRHWDAWTSGEVPAGWPLEEYTSLESMTTADGAEHRRLRSLIVQAFTPRRVAALRPRQRDRGLAGEIGPGRVAGPREHRLSHRLDAACQEMPDRRRRAAGDRGQRDLEALERGQERARVTRENSLRGKDFTARHRPAFRVENAGVRQEQLLALGRHQSGHRCVDRGGEEPAQCSTHRLVAAGRDRHLAHLVPEFP